MQATLSIAVQVQTGRSFLVGNVYPEPQIDIFLFEQFLLN